MTLHTRKDYMEHCVSHEDYYGQFVTPLVTNFVVRSIGRSRIVESKDSHFNDIPLHLWDRLFGYSPLHGYSAAQDSMGVGSALRRAGDYPTLAGFVCIAKEAARQIRAANTTTHGETQ